MQLSNVRRIIVEDFPKESRELVGKLAEILNSFMQETVELSQNRIDFDNLNRTLISVDLTVDANSIPVGLSQINMKLASFSGQKIVNTQALAGGASTTGAVHMDCTYVGSGIVKVNKIYGLPPGKKIRVTFEFIG